jgi:hypothetical protein
MVRFCEQHLAALLTVRLNQVAPASDYHLMMIVVIKKRSRSRWQWRVLDSSGTSVMSGWENSRPGAGYHGARALFLLLAHPKRNTEDAG